MRSASAIEETRGNPSRLEGGVKLRPNVRGGSSALVLRCPRRVGFAPDSGQFADITLTCCTIQPSASLASAEKAHLR